MYCQIWVYIATIIVITDCLCFTQCIIDSIREDDKINFPLEIFSKEVDSTALNGSADNRGVVTLKAVNDPNAYWFVDPYPNKVCLSSETVS